MAIAITSTSPAPNAIAGAPYTHTFTASGSGSTTYEWTIDSNAPPGLVLNPATGQISISNPIEGVWTFGLGVSDPVDPTDRAFMKMELTVDPSSPVPPTVRITQMEEDAVVSGTAVVIQAQVQAFNAVITDVEFILDGAFVPFASRTAYPWQVTLETTSLTNGPHTIEAKVTDSNGSIATSVVRNFEVVNDLVDTPPHADFTMASTPSSQLIPVTVDFTNTSTNHAVQYWFIDGVYQASTTNLNHVFTTSGEYTIKLVVQSATGVVDQIEKKYYAMIPAGQASTNGLMDEILINPHYSSFASGGPEWATAIERAGSGGAVSQRAINRQDYISRYEIEYSQLTYDEHLDLRTFQILRRGRARFFRFEPPDAHVLIAEGVTRYNATTGELEYVGTGNPTDGVETKFFINKNYSDPAFNYNRYICKPNPLKPFTVAVADAADPGVLIVSHTFQGGYVYNPYAILPEKRTEVFGWLGDLEIDYFVGRLKFTPALPADYIIYVWGEYHLPVAFVSDWHKARIDSTTITEFSCTVEEALPAEIGCSPTEAFNKV